MKHWFSRCASAALWGVLLVLVTCVTVLIALVDLMRWKNLPPLTTRARVRRHKRLPYPIRRGGRIFIEHEDGSEEEVPPLTAKLYAAAWFDVVSGGYVYERTKVPD